MISFNRTFPCLAVLGAVLVFARPVSAQGHSDFLASLMDQKLLLAHLGDQQKVKIKKQKLDKLTRGCDMAVELKRAEWNHGKARLWVQTIGNPHFAGTSNAVGGHCRTDQGEIEVEVSGFAKNEPVESVEAAVRQILFTPDQYVVAGGIAYTPATGVEDEVPLKCGPPIVAPRLLLMVEPNFSEQARKAKYQGTVKIGIIIGSDGRIHKPHITRSLGMGLDEQALNVLPMWRFQPATQAGKAVACEMSIETSFNLY